MSDADAGNTVGLRRPDQPATPAVSDLVAAVPISWVDGTAAAAVTAPRLGLLALLPLRCQDRLLRLTLGGAGRRPHRNR